MWLDLRPDPDLLVLWADFTQARLKVRRLAALNAHHERMSRLAIDVALASGGFLGFGAICLGEQTVLDNIHAVLSCDIRSYD